MVTLQMEAEKVRAETINSTPNVDTSIENKPGVKLPKLPEFREAEGNIDAYLLRFERHAENAEWNRDDYALGLSCLLTGRALEVYCRLPTYEMNDYDKRKHALLVKFSLTEENFRKTFYSSKQGPGETASQHLARLENFFDQWIKLSGIDNSYDKLKELILRDQFLHSCPRDQALFIREPTPKDISSFKELTEVFTTSRSAVGIRDQIKMTPVHRQAIQCADRDPSPSFSHPLREPARCYLCDKVRHIARNCPTGKQRPSLNPRPWIPKNIAVNACLVVDNPNHQCSNQAILKCGCSFPVVDKVRDHIPSNLPIMQGCVGETSVSILSDTGCSGIVVRRDLVRDNRITGEKRILVMINRSVITVPIARCKIVSPIFSGEAEVSCIINPICDVIIENVPGVHPEV